MSGIWSAIRLGADGNPSRGEIIASEEGDGNSPPKAIMALWEPGRVCIAWTHDGGEPRRLSQKSLASFRRKRLKSRLAKKLPLLADQLFEAELEARPAFFNGETNQ